MRVCLMVEGQEDVTWDQWLGLARACEDHGLEGLFRSDHYVSVRGQTNNGSLDAWTTLAGLGAQTSRIRLGTCVSPATFRHPSVLAKSVVTADHISGGRVELGMGAGWSEIEHVAYGFPFFDTATRMERLGEQVEIVHRQWTEDVFSFDGRHYQLRDLHALPKPVQEPHPPLILGGNAGTKSSRLAAGWADEYNTVSATPDAARERRANLARACEAVGRDPSTLTFSVMTNCIVGTDQADLERRARRLLARTGQDADVREWLAGQSEAKLIGTVEQVVEDVRALEAAGVQRVMLQHLDHDDLGMVELIGREVAPAVA